MKVISHADPSERSAIRAAINPRERIQHAFASDLSLRALAYGMKCSPRNIASERRGCKSHFLTRAVGRDEKIRKLADSLTYSIFTYRVNED